MPTPVNYQSITDFVVKFTQHPSDPKAHTHLNNLYQDCIDKPERLFKDPTAMTELLDEQALLNKIREIIAEEIVGTTNAFETQDLNDITRVIDAAPLFVDSGVSPQRRLSKDSLNRALAAAHHATRTQVEIRVATAHIYFDTSQGPINYLDWSKFSITAPPTSAPVPAPPAPPTAVDIAQAVASAIPPPISPASLATALATALQSSLPSAQAGSTGQATAAAGPATSTTTTGLTFTFNHNAFPPDVRTRYLNKVKKGQIQGSTVRAPYSGSRRLFHPEGMDKLVLADGTFFVLQTPNEKGIMKASIFCEDATHAGIRSWYDNFAQACHDYGYYAHPLWCFKRDHGGDRGFTIGNDPDDDLPDYMEIPILKMSNPLFRLLSKKEMFPKGSRLSDIVRSCDGDGYRAIKSVIFQSHPSFHDQPSTLISSYPKQRDCTILEYYKLFIDFLQLRAFITDVTGTLDDENEFYIFLKNAKYSEYLNRVTRDERRQASLAHKYQGSQLVETLDRLLKAPDSPAMRSRNYQSKTPKLKSAFASPNRFQIPVQAVGYVSDNDDSDEEILEEDADSNGEDILPTAELYSIQVPNDPESREVYHEYCASIHKISAQPQVAQNQPCIVCGGSHKFDKCPVLANTDFLKSHYIRYCQHLRRDAAAKASEFPNVKSPPAKVLTKDKRNARVNFVDSSVAQIGTDSDYDSDEDFQRGRV